MKATDVQKVLGRYASKTRADGNARFFKTGPGEYGEGDLFIGVTVPNTRLVVKQFASLPITETKNLLASKIHEERLCGLLILVDQFRRGDGEARKKIFDLYLSDIPRFVNNWDLVDTSASQIVGVYLGGQKKTLLTKLAKSENLWERRVAIIATFSYIREGQCEETFRIADLLMTDKQDLIHKAVGWMLREAGKKCGEKTLEGFLETRAGQMPRTMLRYAIEKMSPAKRKRWMTT